MRIWILALACVVSFNNLFGNDIFKNKEVVEDEQMWVGYINQTRITKSFGWWNDVHIRSKENFGAAMNNFLIRTGPQFYVKDHFRPSLTYTFLYNFENDDRKTAFCEHRMAQQFWFGHNHDKIRITHLFRNENRWIQKVKDGKAENDFIFRDRVRYNVLANISLSKKGFEPGSILAVLNNELMLNIHAEDNFYVYDQNRFFAGLGVVVSKQSLFHLGYMNLFQQKTDSYELAHAVRFFFFQNIDLRRR